MYQSRCFHIYLDNAATTPVKREVLDCMLPYFEEDYGNPSGFSSFAEGARGAIDHAREQVAGLIGAKPAAIFFTSGGTEADNWALKAAAFANRARGNHIITSAIEHHAVLHPCARLEENGYQVTDIGDDEFGRVDLGELRRAIRPETTLISVMFANNEIGTIQPIAEIGAIAHEHGVLFHTDAVQAFGHVPIDVDTCGIDLLSASSHKINGPKGVGMLYIRKGVKLGSFMHGGEQERGRRAGTYNVAGIVGFGKAAALARA